MAPKAMADAKGPRGAPPGHVVFLRAANIGGRNVFRPAALARALDDLDVTNIGAAGTFVVRGRASAARVRRAIRSHLPFAPMMAVVPASEVLVLVRSKPFAGVRFSKDQRGWVGVLDGHPRVRPALPMVVPAGRAWSVRFERLEAPFALGLWHRRPLGFVFPNQVVEKALGVRATMRWWETMQRAAELLESAEDLTRGAARSSGRPARRGAPAGRRRPGRPPSGP